jgi:hypothetical protein
MDGFAGGLRFTLPDDLRGKPLVLNVWASWCKPCRTEMPVFQAVYLQLQDRVGFLGATTSSTSRTRPAAWLSRRGHLPAGGRPPRPCPGQARRHRPADHRVHRGRRGASRPPGGGAERQPVTRRDPQLPVGGGAVTSSRRHRAGGGGWQRTTRAGAADTLAICGALSPSACTAAIRCFLGTAASHQPYRPRRSLASRHAVACSGRPLPDQAVSYTLP